MSGVAMSSKDEASTTKKGESKRLSSKPPTTISPTFSTKRLPKFERQWRMQLADSVTAIAYSPNGQHLAAASAAGEVLWGTPDQPPRLLVQKQEAMSCIGFSSSGHFLAAAGQAGQVIVWSLDKSEPNSESAPEPAIVFSQALTKDWVDCFAWHPTEPILAIGVNSKVQLWHMPDQTLVTELAFERSSVLALAWHPQGAYLSVSGHGGVSVWAAADWSLEPEFIEVPGASIAAQWSADGRYLGSGNLDRTLMVMDWGNPPPWFMQGFPGKVRQISWSHLSTASGSPLIAAACANGISIWERETKQDGIWQSRVLEKHADMVKAIAFHPQSFTLATASQDGKLVLWHNAKTAAQTLKGAKQGWSAIAWSPDGTSLVAGGQAGELIQWAPSSRGQGFQ